MMMTNSMRQVLLSVAVVTLATVLLLNREHGAAVLSKSSGRVRRTSIKNMNERFYELRQHESPRMEAFAPDDEDWPPLDSLIGFDEKDIKKDVQFMLDFAIIGPPKMATTFTMNWLASHPEVEMYQNELKAMQFGRPAELVSLLYKFPPGRNYKRAYKNPNDLINRAAMQAFSEYFPKTKLIVGLRYVDRGDALGWMAPKTNMELPLTKHLLHFRLFATATVQ